jgi:hypothetical protein
MKKIVFALIFVAILSGCYYDRESELYGAAAPCDSTAVTYSGAISSILNQNGCIGCHSGSTPSGNINLQGYTNVKTVALNGKLVGAISHDPAYSPMPKGGGKLSTCDINKVKAWVSAGAQNN